MIEIKYTSSASESAQATFDFLANRPVISLMFTTMKVMCILLCIGFAITIYTHSTRVEDIVTAISALIWILFFKQINRWIIKHSLKVRKFDDIDCMLRIDDKSILYKQQANNPQHIEWKKLKFVLKTKHGYIIPLTGFTNAGRFLWLPMRSLQADAEQQFLALLNKFKLKLKNINL